MAPRRHCTGRGYLRTPSLSLLNLGHHPPQSPRGLFSLFPDQISAALGSLCPPPLQICMSESGGPLPPWFLGDWSCSPFPGAVKTACLWAQAGTHPSSGSSSPLAMLCSGSFASGSLQNVLCTQPSLPYNLLFFLGHYLSSFICSFGDSDWLLDAPPDPCSCGPGPHQPPPARASL